MVVNSPSDPMAIFISERAMAAVTTILKITVKRPTPFWERYFGSMLRAGLLHTRFQRAIPLLTSRVIALKSGPLGFTIHGDSRSIAALATYISGTWVILDSKKLTSN